MSTPSFDPGQYKAGQRQLWDTVASGWKKWWPTQEQAAQPVSDRLVELAEIRSGHRVLDVGTGIGEPALTAAQRVGAAGHVVATDQALQMLAVGQERALALGVQNVEFRDMDAEALDFPGRGFDAILSRFSLMFLPDLATALARIWRMLRPKGKFATAVWDVAPKVPSPAWCLVWHKPCSSCRRLHRGPLQYLGWQRGSWKKP
jgi:ubiquinone/menaquinone biosynthesis C-methylase UbiE